jgi:putative nucleotidyltransferase with HDIG domain
MAEDIRKNWLQFFTRKNLFRAALLVLVSVFSFASLIMPIALRPSYYVIQKGNVSDQDIQAPRALTYTSSVLTEQAREDAEKMVAPIYLPSDPSITRQQIERLRVALNYINSIRYDTFATPEQKIKDLSAIDGVQLDEQTETQILDLNDSRWQIVQQEALNVLEQVMRNTIREGQIYDLKRNVPSLISFSLSQDQAQIVTDLVIPFISANSLFSEELTNKAKSEARDAVAPVERTFAAGESVVRRGQIVTDLTWEALEQFGFIQPKDNTQSILASAALVSLVMVFIALYFNRRKLPLIRDLRGLALISFTFLVFLYGARLLIPNRAIVPYIFPLQAFGMTIASLYTMEIGLVFSLVLSILAAYGIQNSLDLTLFYILSGLCGLIVLGKGRRIASFFWAGMAIGCAGSAIILAYRLPDTITDWIGIATLIGASFISGLASASLTLLLQFLYSQILGLVTSLQLLEISRPDNPLLQFLLRNSPGTYQHSLQVANLAEQAAEAIGADPMLTRVGALYHDAGKSTNPSFFIENQVVGKINPHDDLDPATSAATIIRHVPDGIQLARKYRLPPRIQDFIREHHGTLITRYQYAKAVQAVGDRIEAVNLEVFRYPGPRPRSKETALLMLADGCEARARAEIPKDEAELRILVKKVFEYCQREGQLDDTTLTLRDLNIAADSFCNTLRNTYHPRIQYPEIKTSQVTPENDHVPSYSENKTHSVSS